MAVSITDNRTILDQADSTTNFNTGSAHSTIYAEAGYCIAESYNIATGQIYYNGTCPNFTTAGNELIYLWSACIATLNSYKESTPGDSSHAMWLSDGTNDLIIYMAGNDRDVFKHSDGQVTFQCFMVDIDYLDTLNSNGDLAAINGSYASFSKSGISEVGAHYTTLSKALGGGVNCYLDIIRYGTEGITIYGGGIGTEGNFSEIAAEDRSTADQKAYGIIRAYTSSAYGAQGTMKFGTTTATGDAYFEDSGVSLTFEDRPVADDKFKFIVQGNTSDTNSFVLSNSSIVSARPGVEVDMSSANIDTLTLTGVSFVNLLNSISFPTDSATGGDHDITGCTFANCGQISPGTANFTNNIISDYSGTTNGALLIDSNSDPSNWSGLSFKSSGSGHAIYITATGTYTFSNYTYDGYATSDGSTGNEVVYNNSGGSVTINVSGGDAPSVRNGTGATTTVVSSVTLTINVKDEDGNLLDNVQTAIYKISDRTELMNEDTVSGVASTTYGGTTPVDVEVRCRKASAGTTKYINYSSLQTISSNGLTLNVTMREDPNNNATS